MRASHASARPRVSTIAANRVFDSLLLPPTTTHLSLFRFASAQTRTAHRWWTREVLFAPRLPSLAEMATAVPYLGRIVLISKSEIRYGHALHDRHEQLTVRSRTRRLFVPRTARRRGRSRRRPRSSTTSSSAGRHRDLHVCETRRRRRPPRRRRRSPRRRRRWRCPRRRRAPTLAGARARRWRRVGGGAGGPSAAAGGGGPRRRRWRRRSGGRGGGGGGRRRRRRRRQRAAGAGRTCRGGTRERGGGAAAVPSGDFDFQRCSRFNKARSRRRN